MTGEVTDQIILFSMILMRMSGFVLLNPVLGRRGIPGMIKAGMIMILTIMIYPISEITGRVPVMALELVLCLLKEFAIGYLIGFIMQLFDYVVTFAGSLIDFHMGLSMASVYDPASGAQVALTGSVLNIYYAFVFCGGRSSGFDENSCYISRCGPLWADSIRTGCLECDAGNFRRMYGACR